MSVAQKCEAVLGHGGATISLRHATQHHRGRLDRPVRMPAIGGLSGRLVAMTVEHARQAVPLQCVGVWCLELAYQTLACTSYACITPGEPPWHQSLGDLLSHGAASAARCVRRATRRGIVRVRGGRLAPRLQGQRRRRLALLPGLVVASSPSPPHECAPSPSPQTMPAHSGCCCH